MKTNITTEKNEKYYIKDFINKVIRYWYILIGTIFLFILLAFFHNWHAESVYQVSTIILVKENTNNVDPGREFLESFPVFESVDNLQNEILVLQSSSLIYDAIINTGLSVYYYKKEHFKQTELYNDSPFIIDFDPYHPQPVNIKFEIIPIDENNFRLVVSADDEVFLYDYINNSIAGIIDEIEFDDEFNFDQTVSNEYFKFRVQKDSDKMSQFDAKTQFYFQFNDLVQLVYDYQSILNITPVSEEVSAAEIKINLNHPQKGIDFINNLTQSYLKRNLDKKNYVAENTIDYIDDQLSNIEDSLRYTEQNLQNFRSRNQIMDINSKAERIFDMVSVLEEEKSQLEMKAKYYNYIDEYLQKQKDFDNMLVPSSMGVDDPVLSNIIEDLINLNTEKSNLHRNNQDKSPYFQNLSNRIDILQNTLSENVKYLINTNDIALLDINDRLYKLNAQIQQLPRTERQLFGIERKFKLNDNIYTFLLERRAEAQIAKASNLPDNEIIEPARLTKNGPISPNKKANFIIAFLLGIIVPMGAIYSIEALNETIKDEIALKNTTSIPILGKIIHNSSKDQNLVLSDGASSLTAESFRSLRTNLDYYLQGEINQVILVTSTTSGEGKSFAALNLAASLALLNYKTIIIEFDMRKPRLSEYLSKNNNNGISSYLINKVLIEDIIESTPIENLDFIPAGKIPPNPSEIINSKRTEKLLNEFKEQYDFIILDTPPAGLVTDPFQLMKYTDLNIYIVRENYTPKRYLESVLYEMEDKEISKICLLLNDVYSKSGYYQRRYKTYSTKKSKK